MINEAEIMLQVLSEHGNHPKWNGSSFERIKLIPNTKVGDVGQDFLERVCQQLSFECLFPLNKLGERAKQSSWDVQIEGVKFELKTASEDTTGKFQFNHIRYHREYEGVICIGISPEIIYFELWDKAEITTGKAGRLVSMEKNANASYKLTKKPSELKPIADFAEHLVAFVQRYNLS